MANSSGEIRRDGGNWPKIIFSFFVPGIPRTAGSKRVFINRKTGYPIVTDDNARSKDWRASVALAASQVIRVPLTGPIHVSFEFNILRPKGHWGKKGLRDSAPRYPAKRPDLLKLARSTEDALTGIAFHDDAQIVSENLFKFYSHRSGVEIAIQPMLERGQTKREMIQLDFPNRPLFESQAGKKIPPS